MTVKIIKSYLQQREVICVKLLKQQMNHFIIKPNIKLNKEDQFSESKRGERNID